MKKSGGRESSRHTPWVVRRMSFRAVHGVCLLLCTMFFCRVLVSEVDGQHPAATSDQIQFFETKIRPVLVEHCYECHAAGAKIVQAGLRVDHREGSNLS